LTLLQRFIAEFGFQVDGIEEDTLDGLIRLNRLRRLFADLMETPSWGNGRDVRTLARTVARRVFVSCTPKDAGTSNLAVSFEELLEVIQQMLATKKQKGK
jgi:hypothetical protein